MTYNDNLNGKRIIGCQHMSRISLSTTSGTYIKQAIHTPPGPHSTAMQPVYRYLSLIDTIPPGQRLSEIAHVRCRWIQTHTLTYLAYRVDTAGLTSLGWSKQMQRWQNSANMLNKVLEPMAWFSFWCRVIIAQFNMCWWHWVNSINLYGWSM